MASPLPPAMSAGRAVDAVDDGNSIRFNDLDTLGISVPVETTRYAFVEMFLTRALNLKNDVDILELCDNHHPHLKRRTKHTEILPQIAVPPDLWLQPQICISSVKAKNGILREVNLLLQETLEAFQAGSSPGIYEANVALLEAQIKGSNFTQFPRPDVDADVRFDPLEEADEDCKSEEETSILLEKRNTLLLELRSYSFSSNASSLKSNNRNRMSSFSRDLKSSTRKFTFLALPNSKILPPEDESKIQTPPQTPPLLQSASASTTPVGMVPNPRDSSHSITNGLLAKSRLYSKIKKRRELAALASSSIANSSIQSPSNINMQRSAAPDVPDTKRGSAQISISQQYENQKEKHEYYCQLRDLALKTRDMIKFVCQKNFKPSSEHLMEFIKTDVFKFILIDVLHMILDYGHLEVFEPHLQ